MLALDKMNILFISELSFIGKVPRNHENMRTEYAWMCALNADHVPISNAVNNNLSLKNKYDLAITILPKKLHLVDTNLLLNFIKNVSNKSAVMQEGPFWYYQDYDYVNQVNYINFLGEMDFLLTHNKNDISYFKGFFKKPTFNLQSLIIKDCLSDIVRTDNGYPIIGGNFCSWYGGVDSYIVAKNFKSTHIYAPSMGRKINNEDEFPNLVHIPYSNWKSWMKSLSSFHVGIHLMRTHAAGTFALNCAYFGIPCIGYKGLDTQETLFPDLSVRDGDIESANNIAIRLKEDSEFYNYVSNKSKESYVSYYSEEKWLTNWKNIFN